MKTTIYLDVDGVLNAVSKRTPSLKITGWENWKTKPVNGWPILYSPDMVALINDLAAREEVTFKWLTTWEDDAAKVLSPAIGINGQEWEVLHGDQHAWGGERGWWKLDAIRADVEATDAERVAWIDDDIKAEPAAIEWINSRDDVLGISPRTSHGIDREDLERIERYTETEKESEAA